jgi:hypothetical protein
MKEKETNYASYCSVCGLAITVPQISVMIDNGEIIDFNDKCFIDLSIHICNDCWEKIKVNTLGGMKKAVAKSEKLKRMNAECARR